MAQSTTPTVAVLGSTGNQGGSVCKFLLRDGKFKVRAITRDPTKEKARRLAEMGAEVVKADMSNKKQLEMAFAGAHAVFSVTDYKEHKADGELKLGKQTVDVAKEAGVQVFIFSTLPYIRKITNGKLACGQFDAKAEVEEYARTKGFPYVAFVELAWFFENWLTKKPELENDQYILSLPVPGNTVLPHISVEETGAAVLAILNDPGKWNNKRLPVTNGEQLSLKQHAEIFGKVMGKSAIYKPRSIEEVKQKSTERANMYLYISDYGYYQNTEDVTAFKKIYPETMTWEEFVEKNKAEFTNPSSEAP
jgi:uncharacterized protein YbjT (DUF2867 family)